MKVEISGEGKNPINTMIEDMLKIEEDLKERCLAKIVQENDFIVNNAYMKIRLEEVLPKGAKISISPYVDESTVIMIKKAILKPHLVPYDFDDLKEQEND